MAQVSEATARELVTETAALRAAIGELSERLDGTDDRAARNRRGLIILGVIVAALVALAVTNYSTNAAQARTAAQQEVLLRDFICPTSALLVGGYRPDTRPAGEARDAYAESIDGLRAARLRQACADPLVPPALPSPPGSGVPVAPDGPR